MSFCGWFIMEVGSFVVIFAVSISIGHLNHWRMTAEIIHLAYNSEEEETLVICSPPQHFTRRTQFNARVFLCYPFVHSIFKPIVRSYSLSIQYCWADPAFKKKINLHLNRSSAVISKQQVIISHSFVNEISRQFYLLLTTNRMATWYSINLTLSNSLYFSLVFVEGVWTGNEVKREGFL